MADVARIDPNSVAQGIRNTATWTPPYETNIATLAKANPISNVLGLGIPAVARSVAGGVGNVVDAMFTPDDPTKPLPMVASRTQDVADQLGGVAKNLSQPAAVAVQAATGAPVVGNNPAAIAQPAAPSAPLGIKSLASHIPGDDTALIAARATPTPPSATPAAPAPAAQGVGSYIKTLDNGKVFDASGQATGGFGMPEASRLKNVAINDARQAEMNAALDRGSLNDANSAVDLWRTKIAQATTPFELQQAQAGLAGAQAQLTTLTGTKNAEITGGFGLKGHEVVAQSAKEAQTEAARIAGEAKVDAAEATNSTEKAKLAADARIKAAEIAANAPAVKEQAAADALLAGQLGIGLDQVKALREAGGTFKKRSGFPGFRKPAGFYDAQGNLMDPTKITPKAAAVPAGFTASGKLTPDGKPIYINAAGKKVVGD